MDSPHELADRQRALAEGPRPRKVALGLKQASEVVEALRRIGMFGAEHLLADRQRLKSPTRVSAEHHHTPAYRPL